MKHFAPVLLITACLTFGLACNRENIPMAELNEPAASAADAREAEPSGTEQATLGGGCFWCVEAPFLQLDGVEQVVSGYAGGDVPNPTYEMISTGATGHAEVVQVTYDPAKLSYSDVLEVFFTVHDPTQLNRQGADVGTQYRSVIFYHDEKQKEIAEQRVRQLDEAGAFDRPIVTELSPLPEFYRAEDYHQNYYAQNSQQPYCQMVVRPKVEKVREVFADKLRE